MAIWGSRDTIVYLEVCVVADPATRILVKTTEDRVGSKRRAIKRDIDFQTFPRWAPFKNQKYTIRLLDEHMIPYNQEVTA